MKKSMCLFAASGRLVCLTAILFVLLAAPGAQSENPGKYMMRNMFRGIFNVIASPVEIPRLVVYETAENWAYGPFLGLGEGIYCTVFRELLSSWDIVTFGLLPEGTSPYGFYKTKDYFWEEDWLPPEPQLDTPADEASQNAGGPGTGKKKGRLAPAQ